MILRGCSEAEQFRGQLNTDWIVFWVTNSSLSVPTYLSEFLADIDTLVASLARLKSLQSLVLVVELNHVANRISSTE